MGYDIADYEDIDPAYGTLADVDNLIKELKKRDMRLVMDLVVNHTSNEVSLGTHLENISRFLRKKIFRFCEGRKTI